MKRIALLAAVAPASCSSTPPETVEYLLRPDANDGVTTLDPRAKVALGRVSTAPYLDRDGIVLERQNHRVTVARNHRWAESLSQSLRRVLQVEIGRAAGVDVGDAPVNGDGHEVLIDVVIHQFHGSVSGTAKLIAEWRLRQSSSNQVVSAHAFSRKTPLTADGYDNLVQTQIDLLTNLAAAIAASLAEESPASQVELLSSTAVGESAVGERAAE